MRATDQLVIAAAPSLKDEIYWVSGVEICGVLVGTGTGTGIGIDLFAGAATSSSIETNNTNTKLTRH